MSHDAVMDYSMYCMKLDHQKGTIIRFTFVHSNHVKPISCTCVYIYCRRYNQTNFILSKLVPIVMTFLNVLLFIIASQMIIDECYNILSLQRCLILPQCKSFYSELCLCFVRLSYWGHGGSAGNTYFHLSGPDSKSW